MKILSALNVFLGLTYFAMACGILGNMCGWWTLNFSDGSAFCACLICSMYFFHTAKEV